MTHEDKVAAVARALRERPVDAGPVHIHKGGVHHFVPLPGDRRFDGRAVDVSGLREILAIDPVAKTATVEPGVTFAELLAATLAHGLIPTVVPELEGITVGGAIAGCSVESMSFRHGGFHDSALEYEVVTGQGDVVTCTPTRDAELFHMIHGSYGTLGVLTRVTFRLVPAKAFVKLEYVRLPDAASFEREMRARCAAPDTDFVDGIIHGPDDYVLCVGRFVDQAPYTSSYRWLDIFYKSTRTRREDYLTTADYCFRYDTECHWLTRTVPPLEWKPVRFAVGKVFLGSTNLIKWSGRLERVLKLKKRPEVIVDVFIPARNFGAFMDWYQRDFPFWPLWIVPYRIETPYPWIAKDHAAAMQDQLMIDCAVYGKKNVRADVDDSQVLEEKTYQLGGIKTLISRNHHSRQRFWEIYNEPAYRKAKQRMDPGGAFADLYDKFHRA
jgi:FAD/FMN-containing dehydrogenase